MLIGSRVSHDQNAHALALHRYGSASNCANELYPAHRRQRKRTKDINIIIVMSDERLGVEMIGCG